MFSQYLSTMPQEPFDFVIPLYKWRWNTQAVVEGLTTHYQPRNIHIIAPPETVQYLQQVSGDWQTASLHIHDEDVFFSPIGLTKDEICQELDLGESLYTPGWFYQQLLKVGAYEGIPDLSEWYAVWDSDLLPADAWPMLTTVGDQTKHTFALLQHKDWGNPAIVSKWAYWIETILGVEAATAETGTLISHHMWFKQEHLKSMGAQVGRYFNSMDHWLLLMMRSANEFGTYGEYWVYSSWVATKAPEDLSYHPYDAYGATTERFFDDGTALFSQKLRQHQGIETDVVDFSPSYTEVMDFIRAEYPPDPLPSSLSFESSPRHLKKNTENMHIEELRSRWNPRNTDDA